MIWLLACVSLHVQAPTAEAGSFAYSSADTEQQIPPMYRMGSKRFSYNLSAPAQPEPGFTTQTLRFPSPVESPFPENNIVHAVYYRSRCLLKVPIGRLERDLFQQRSC